MKPEKDENKRFAIARLYLSGNYSMREIGDKYGISPQRVQQYLSERGIGRTDILKQRDRRIMEAADAGDSVSAIARKLGINWNSVQHVLKRENKPVKKDGRGRKRMFHDRDKKIAELYVETEMSQADIGRLYGFAPSFIGYILKREGVDTAKHSKRGMRTGRIGFTAADKQKMCELYDKGWSQSKIARAFKSSQTNIRGHLLAQGKIKSAA